ncbi:MAG: site-specific integrase, partial [Rhodanobacteraceae bacterium]
MATIVKTHAGNWKAVVRKKGWPTTSKTFRTKRDAQDWGRQTEDQIVRGIYVERVDTDQVSFAAALDRYLSEVTPTKRPSTQRSEVLRAKPLRKYFGHYAMVAIG